MKLKKGMITEEANGEFVAVATGEASKSFNGLIRNNATADFIFRQLETDKTEAQIVDAMLEKYDVSKEIVQKQVPISKIIATGLFEKLIKMKFDVPNSNIALLDNYITEIDELLGPLNKSGGYDK